MDGEEKAGVERKVNTSLYKHIYVDSNAFIGGGWPSVSTNLANLINLAARQGSKVYLLDLVEQELRAHFLRDCFGTREQLEKKMGSLQSLLDRIGYEFELELPHSDEISDRYDEIVDYVVEETGLQRIKVEPRASVEMFERAIWHRRPFKEQGKCFQDALIALSVIDHLSTTDEKKGAFVSGDGALEQSLFDELVLGTDVTVTVYQKADDLFQLFFNHIVDFLTEKRIAETRAEWGLAEKAIKENLNTIEEFIKSNLELPEMIGFTERLVELTSIKIDSIRDVRTPIKKEEFGGQVTLSCQVDLNIDAVAENLFPLARPRVLKFGQESAEKGKEAAAPLEAKRQIVIKRTGELQMTAERIASGYTSVQPTSLALS